MRIAIDARATQTEHRLRGIGRSVVDLIHALAKYGDGDEYALIVQNSMPVSLGELPGNFRIVPIDGPLLDLNAMTWVMRVRGLRGSNYGRSLNERILLREHRNGLKKALREFRTEVFHATVPVDVFTDTGGDLGCRKVVTFYDAIPRLDPTRSYDLMTEKARRQYDRQLAAVADADAIVAISKSSREEAIEYAGADPEKAYVVYLSVPDDFEGEAHENVERFTEGRPYFLFLSALSPYKNPLGVLRAFAKTDCGQRLVFLSSHRSESYPEVRSLVEDLGVQDSVTITDVVSDEAVKALVQGATALVSPSFYEGFGLPAAQAMRAGVPAIVSNRKSQPEVVGDAGIVVDPDDIEALATAMRRIATDATFRRDLSERGRARAMLFSMERLARNMADVYHGRPPSAPIPPL